MVTKKKRKKIDKFYIFLDILMIILGLIFVVPYLIIVSTSFSSESSVSYNGYMLFPKEFSFEAYKYIFTTDKYMFNSLLNTLYMAIGGTFLALVVVTMYAFAASRSRLPGVKFFNNYAIFTMLFGGGLVPYYILMSKLGLRDSLWAIVLPALMQPWTMILTRNYFMGLSNNLEEAAQIDGANPYQILVKIYIPISMPIIASVTLFTVVGFWNNWYGPLLFIESKEKYPIAYLVRNMLNELSAGGENAGSASQTLGNVPLISSRMAAIVISSLPILVLYPFLQKYYVNGVATGAIKE